MILQPKFNTNDLADCLCKLFRDGNTFNGNPRYKIDRSVFNLFLLLEIDFGLFLSLLKMEFPNAFRSYKYHYTVSDIYDFEDVVREIIPKCIKSAD